MDPAFITNTADNRCLLVICVHSSDGTKHPFEYRGITRIIRKLDNYNLDNADKHICRALKKLYEIYTLSVAEETRCSGTLPYSLNVFYKGILHEMSQNYFIAYSKRIYRDLFAAELLQIISKDRELSMPKVDADDKELILYGLHTWKLFNSLIEIAPHFDKSKIQRSYAINLRNKELLCLMVEYGNLTKKPVSKFKLYDKNVLGLIFKFLPLYEGYNLFKQIKN